MIPPLILNLLQGAKRGMYTIMCSQLPSELSKACRSASTVISFNLNSESEAGAIFPSLRLSTKEQEAYFGGLKDREAIVCKHETHPVPVLIRTLEFRLPRVSNDELDAVMEDELAWLMEDVRLDSAPVDTGNGKKPLETEKPEAETETQQELAGQEAAREKPEVENLHREELRLLHDIVSYPYDGITDRYARLKISASKGDKLKKSLARKKLAIEHKANVSGRGGATTLLEPTQLAYQMLKLEAPRKRGIGEFVHRFYQDAVKSKFKDQGTCEIEAKLPNGKLIDVLVARDGNLIGIEIEMQACKHILVNIEKDLEAGLDRLVIAAPSMDVLEGIQQLLQQHGNGHDTSKIELTLVSRLLQSEM